jgi:putative ABC transport system permease protein
MWLIAARDLQYRRRRFLIAIVATGLVFGIALLLDGASTNITDETTRIVGVFHADRFLVATRATGPFTTTVVIPDRPRPVVPRAGGRADPFVVSRATVRAGKLVDVNLVGYRPGGLGTPPIDEGRAVRAPGEVVVDASLDAGVGDRLRVGDLELRVVGTSSGIRFNFGTPSLFVALADAQRIVFDDQPLVMAYAARGPVRFDGQQLREVTNAQAEDDLHRTTKSGSDTVSFINVLLWIVAAGIVASIVYLNALERTRDFAVLKATGSSNRSIVGGLAVQATVLTVLAAILAVGIAFVLKPGFPFPVTLSVGSVVKIVGVAVVVGLLASLVGVRRAVSTDPAIAIGGA